MINSKYYQVYISVILISLFVNTACEAKSIDEMTFFITRAEMSSIVPISSLPLISNTSILELIVKQDSKKIKNNFIVHVLMVSYSKENASKELYNKYIGSFSFYAPQTKSKLSKFVFPLNSIRHWLFEQIQKKNIIGIILKPELIHKTKEIPTSVNVTLIEAKITNNVKFKSN